ncbi:glycosyltransferase involved in cell wall biosynthesis [Lysinibacillus parviboronicapiens]|uniref:Glycosyltransferase involved in cell wall biosynthesis n=1 Tax=Lysinibacillus parviboronicapiens TaxID=436516 RepID=A0ABV2PID6_9BACI
MLVSVLINNYNYGEFLKECIDSVVNQSYSNIEIVVYDDGSRDDSLTLLKEYKDKITLIAKENYGKSPNINQMNAIYRAFLEAKGDIILLLDSDDYFKKDKVEKVVNVFKENPEIEIVQHLLEEVDRKGKARNSIVPILKKVGNHKDYILTNSSLSHLFVPTSGLAFKKTFLDKALPLKEDEATNLWADTRLMLLGAITTKIINLYEPLTCYRQHGNNNFGGIGDFSTHQKYLKELFEYYNKITENNNLMTIEFTEQSFLENTIFFEMIDMNEINSFFIDEANKAFEYWIWGAGEAGQSVYHALRNRKFSIIGFIDNDQKKQGQMIMGQKVHSPEDIVFSDNIKILVSPYHAYENITDELKKYALNEGKNFISPYKKKILY